MSTVETVVTLTDRVVEALRGEQKSTRELAHELGENRTRIADRLRNMKRQGLVHVVGWERTTGQPIPIYALGFDDSMPQPNVTEENRVSYDGGRRFMHMGFARNVYLKPARDWAVAALFGERGIA